MADTKSSIFNQPATQRLRNPDDLDKYLGVTTPSVWYIIGACIALLLGLLAWGVFGAVTTSVSTTGVCVDGSAMCFLEAEDAAKVQVGDVAVVGGEQMKVASISRVPVSRDEASGILRSDYLVSALVEGDWAYQVVFQGTTGSLDENVPLTVTITTERIAPIRLVLGGNA